MDPRIALRRSLRAALAVPLFWKILIANAVVVVGAALLGRVVVGLGASLLVNAVLVRTALRPLALVEHAAARVRDGDLDARAIESPLADPGLRSLARAFNEALDALAASRARARALLTHSLEEDEEERRRVAAVLEDDIAQRLAGLLLRLRLAERSPNRAELVALLREAGAEVAGAAEVVRTYALGRRSSVLEELGLVCALRAEARRLAAGRLLDVQVEGEEPALPPETARAAYRILREALDNAARHAGARAVRVRIAGDEGTLVAVVEDDGRGFDPRAAEDGPGFGLAAMRERTESAGGRFTLWSAPGRGARVRVDFPLPAGEPDVAYGGPPWRS